MDDSNRTLSLSDRIENLDEHLVAGKQRMRAYYIDSETPPERYSPLEKPPHQHLIERAAEIIVYASNGMTADGVMIDQRQVDPELRFPMFGIGAEILLTGIHLQSNPEEFISIMDNPDKEDTPAYGDSKNVLLANLSDELTNEQRKRINQVLDLIRKQRNNIAHFGFHSRVYNGHFELICDVLGYLLSSFSEEDLKEVEILDETRTELKRRHVGMRYPEVEFEF